MAKATKPKHVLEPIKVKVAEKRVKEQGVLTLRVEGDYPSRYNEASSIKKAAEKLMEELKPNMVPQATETIFAENEANPFEPVKSVALQDDTGNVTRVTMVNKFNDVPVEMAEALFSRIKLKNGQKPDINNYLARVVSGTFDNSIFLGPDNKFDKKRFQKVMDALNGVAAELRTKNPLSLVTTISPLPSFPAQRWIDFDRETNLRISSVIMNQVNCVPCPNALTGLMCGEEPESE